MAGGRQRQAELLRALLRSSKKERLNGMGGSRQSRHALDPCGVVFA
jgi:hypothetical protein